MSDITQESNEKLAADLEDKRAELRQLRTQEYDNLHTVELETTHAQLTAEAERLDAEIAEARVRASVDTIREGAPTLASQRDEMERQLAEEQAKKEAKGTRRTPHTPSANAGKGDE